MITRGLRIASCFSIPVGGLDGPSPTLHLVSISETAVDWERTDSYAQATRARQYAATQGETDFDVLSNDVARALHDVATTKDPARRLALATEARRMLTAWPAAHHGYRASDVAQLASLLDDAVGEFACRRGAAAHRPGPRRDGEPAAAKRAGAAGADAAREHRAAFKAASVTEDPTERVALLEAIVSGLPSSRTAREGEAGLSR